MRGWACQLTAHSFLELCATKSRSCGLFHNFKEGISAETTLSSSKSVAACPAAFIYQRQNNFCQALNTFNMLLKLDVMSTALDAASAGANTGGQALQDARYFLLFIVTMNFTTLGIMSAALNPPGCRSQINTYVKNYPGCRSQHRRSGPSGCQSEAAEGGWPGWQRCWDPASCSPTPEQETASGVCAATALIMRWV